MAFRQTYLLRQALLNRGVIKISGNDVRWSQFRSLRTGKQMKSDASFGPGKQRLVPFEPSNEYIDPGKLWTALAFSCGFGVTSFAAVSIWEYEKIRSKAVKVVQSTKNLKKWIKDKVQGTKEEANEVTRKVESLWNQLTPGEKIFAPILVANVAVFGLWRIPSLQPFMIKYFTSNPAARAICWPMILSTFSHYSAFHLFANMYVLHSFSHGAVNSLGREQFLGLYLTGGVLSTFASYLCKTLTRQGGLSLGASGAIMTILAYICSKYPDTQLSILFLPMYTFSAGTAIKVIMGIDIAGIALGWRFFDHAAHLGGAALGLFWCYYGSQHLWPQREHLIGYWHQLRGPITKS